MLVDVMAEDWRVRVEVERSDDLGTFMERLRHGLGQEARDLADALTDHHLVVSRNDNELFVYAGSRSQARQAHKVIEAELQEHAITANVSRVEHWLADEERWDNEPPGEAWEEELLAQGYAPWQVRVTCHSRHDAVSLAERLEGQGYDPVRRWNYLIIGASTQEEAETLALQLHGEAEAGGALVWNEASDAGLTGPFSLF